jgi:hypothetical protein
MADLCDISLRTWAKLEAGEPVSRQLIAAVAERLRLPVDDLIAVDVESALAENRDLPVAAPPAQSAAESASLPDSPPVTAEVCGAQPPKRQRLIAAVAFVVVVIALSIFALMGGFQRGGDMSAQSSPPAVEQADRAAPTSDDDPRHDARQTTDASAAPKVLWIADDFVAEWESALLPSQLEQTRGVYRRNSPGGVGHDLWADGTVQVTGVTINEGEIEKRLQPAREIADALAAKTEQIDADLTLSLDFRAVSTGRRRLFLGPKLLANVGVGKWIDPEQNGSKMELFNEWTDAISTGKLIVHIDYQAEGDDIIQAAMRITEQLDGKEQADDFTRDVLVPLQLTPFVIQELANTGIRVPADKITGTATDTSRAGPNLAQ